MVFHKWQIIIQLKVVVSNNQLKQKVSVVVYSNMEEEADKKTKQEFKKSTQRWQVWHAKDPALFSSSNLSWDSQPSFLLFLLEDTKLPATKETANKLKEFNLWVIKLVKLLESMAPTTWHIPSSKAWMIEGWETVYSCDSSRTCNSLPQVKVKVITERFRNCRRIITKTYKRKEMKVRMPLLKQISSFLINIVWIVLKRTTICQIRLNNQNQEVGRSQEPIDTWMLRDSDQAKVKKMHLLKRSRNQNSSQELSYSLLKSQTYRNQTFRQCKLQNTLRSQRKKAWSQESQLPSNFNWFRNTTPFQATVMEGILFLTRLIITFR